MSLCEWQVTETKEPFPVIVLAARSVVRALGVKKLESVPVRGFYDMCTVVVTLHGSSFLTGDDEELFCFFHLPGLQPMF